MLYCSIASLRYVLDNADVDVLAEIGTWVSSLSGHIHTTEGQWAEVELALADATSVGVRRGRCVRRGRRVTICRG